MYVPNAIYFLTTISFKSKIFKMKKRNLFLSSTLMCGFFCLAFTFDTEGVYWLWSDTKPVAIILTLVTLILGVFLLKETKKMRQKL